MPEREMDAPHAYHANWGFRKKTMTWKIVINKAKTATDSDPADWGTMHSVVILSSSGFSVAHILELFQSSATAKKRISSDPVPSVCSEFMRPDYIVNNFKPS
jgi:hypothetical protein